eukprot:5707064-Pyramimonas_sp.AAC.2
MDDMCNTDGFCRALTYVLGLRPQGLIWAAPPCSSWVWIGRYQTGRSQSRPLGDESVDFVKKANVSTSRICLLIALGIAMRGCIFMAEQPASSIFELHPRWQQLVAALGDNMHKISMWMQPYGGSSRKPTVLYSNSSALQLLWQPLDTSKPSEVRTFTSEVVNGKRCVHGTGSLKGTQAYPEGFGAAVANVYLNECAQNPTPACASPFDLLADASDDPWDDANLDEVLQSLRATVSSSSQGS